MLVRLGDGIAEDCLIDRAIGVTDVDVDAGHPRKEDRRADLPHIPARPANGEVGLMQGRKMNSFHHDFDIKGITERLVVWVIRLPGAAVSAGLGGGGHQDADDGRASAAGRKERLYRVCTQIRPADQAQVVTLVPIAGAAVFHFPTFIEG